MTYPVWSWVHPPPHYHRQHSSGRAYISTHTEHLTLHNPVTPLPAEYTIKRPWLHVFIYCTRVLIGVLAWGGLCIWQGSLSLSLWDLPALTTWRFNRRLYKPSVPVVCQTVYGGLAALNIPVLRHERLYNSSKYAHLNATWRMPVHTSKTQFKKKSIYIVYHIHRYIIYMYILSHLTGEKISYTNWYHMEKRRNKWFFQRKMFLFLYISSIF